MKSEASEDSRPKDEPEPKRASRRRWLARLGLGGGAVVTAGVLLDDRWDLRLTRLTVRLRRLPDAFDGFTIAHLTDIHRGSYVPEDFVRRAAEATTAAEPDLIVLTGDYVTRSTRFMASGAAALARLNAPCGTLAVLGNHDHWTDPDVVSHLLRQTAGARVLKNETEFVIRSGEQLAIAGLDDPVTKNHDLNAALATIPEGCPTVMLAHTPDITPPAAERGVDLVLAGHTHGGQVVLPWIGPPIVNSKYGRRFAAGLKQVRETQVYTNRGVGMAIVPFRVNCPPEVALITLRRSLSTVGSLRERGRTVP